MSIKISALMATSGVRFGTSGARGLVRDLTPEVCWAYTTAFLQAVAPEADTVALGIDLRPSSPAIAQACASAIKAAGRRVVFAGPVPTPALACFAMDSGIPAIMVTGSHIPFDRNGIKFYTSHGEITKQDEEAITAAVVAEPPADLALDDLELQPGVLDHYADRYLAFFPEGLLRGKRIAMYQHSSVARDFLCTLLGKLGAQVIALERTDVFVPIDTEAVSPADQEKAANWAHEFAFDAILSTDGDADRPLIGDQFGRWFRGDVVGLLCARYLGARLVVTPVSSTTSIERCGAFGAVVRTRIGSPYVIEAMDAALARGDKGIVGFEANGGFLVGDPIVKAGRTLAPLPTRDAVLPMLSLLALAGEQSLTLADLADGLPRRFTASDRLQDCPSQASQVLIDALANGDVAPGDFFAGLCPAVTGIDRTDGIRFSFVNGEIVHLRPSGNAPELRCYSEADDPLRAAALVADSLQRVRSRLA